MSYKLIPYEAPDSTDDDHEMLGRPFRVVAKVYNNRLIRAREALGYMTCRQAAIAIGVHYQSLTDLESFKKSPWSTLKNNWTKTASAVAMAYAYHPSELWPEVVRELEARVLVLEVSAVSKTYEQKLPELESGQNLKSVTDKALSTLDSRERKILEERFGIRGEGEKTLDVVGEIEGLSRERVRQLEARALKNIRESGVLDDFKSVVCGED